MHQLWRFNSHWGLTNNGFFTKKGMSTKQGACWWCTRLILLDHWLTKSVWDHSHLLDHSHSFLDHSHWGLTNMKLSRCLKAFPLPSSPCWFGVRDISDISNHSAGRIGWVKIGLIWFDSWKLWPSAICVWKKKKPGSQTKMTWPPVGGSGPPVLRSPSEGLIWDFYKWTSAPFSEKPMFKTDITELYVRRCPT